MKKWILILLFCSAAPASIFINSFNSGRLSKDLKVRVDLERHTMGSETLQNVMVRPQGMAYRRPGTEFIDTQRPSSGTGNYPTLQVADGTFATQQADPGLTQTTAIANVTDLQNMANNLSGNYYLTGNIDASATSGWNAGAGFIPVGTVATPFIGTLDGNGYTISGLTINRNSTYQGLFGQIGTSGGPAGTSIYDLHLTELSISCSGGFCGGLAGVIDNKTITNCSVSGTITAIGNVVQGFGGILGQIYGDSAAFYDCQAGVTIDAGSSHTDKSPQYVGGFAGNADGDTTFDNCRATGNVTGTGVAGHAGDGAGGFIGYAEETSTYTDCTATGNVSGNNSVGGFAGDLAVGCSLIRCSARGDVTATGVMEGAGGFVGTMSGTGGNTAAITDCYAWGSVTADGMGYSGGLGYYVYGDVQITNAYCIGTVSGATVGGFIEYTDNSGLAVPTLTACFWDTEASGETDGIGFDGGPLVTSPVGHVTTWMQTQANYEAAGWDFATVWEIDSDYQDLTGLPVRLIPFEYAVSDAYVLELGHQYIGFLRTVP